MSIRKSTLKKGSQVLEVPVIDPDPPPVEGAEGEPPAEKSPPEPEPEPEPEPDPNPIVYFDITIRDEFVGRIWFELFKNVVPKTVENFRGLCTGEYGVGSSGSCRWYRDSELFKILPNFCIQGGDFIRNNGCGGDSIYGQLFDDENFELKHSDFGMLSMANSGPNTNCSQFIITLVPCPWLDGRHVVFGKVIKGEEVVRKIEANGTKVRGCPKLPVRIKNCGQMPLNTEGNPTRPNFLQGRILAEGRKFPRMDLPPPDQYLPTIWRRKNNSISSDLRRQIKDLQVCIKKTEDVRLELFPKKRIYIERKRRPLHAVGTKRICIINPFAMERNLTYRWKISPFAQADHDKKLGPYEGTSEVPDEKTLQRLSNLLLGQGSEPGNIIPPEGEAAEVEKPPIDQTYDYALAVTGDKKRNTLTPRRFSGFGMKNPANPANPEGDPPPA